MSSFSEMTSQDFELKGTKYRYWVEGDSQKPPLVIFYGFTGVAKDFIEVAKQLKDKYFIIIPEFPGWNGVPRLPEKLTLQNYAIYFKKFVDFLGYSKINLFGHCVGAVEAIEFTYQNPQMVEKLILASPPYTVGARGYGFSLFLAGMAARSPRFLRPIFFFWRSRILTVPLDFFAIKLDLAQKLARIKEHIIKQPHEPEDTMEENWISFMNFDFAKAKKINMRVHLIQGAEDIIVNKAQVEKLQKLFPDATLDIIPDAGHVPPVEATQELIDLIRKYLD